MYLRGIGASGISKEDKRLYPTVAGIFMFGVQSFLEDVKKQYSNKKINNYMKTRMLGCDQMKKKSSQIDIHKTGQNIKRIMQMKGMTVKDIQEYLGLAAVQSVYHWFAGRSLPTVDNLYALSELFCVPIDVLVCGSREKEFYFCCHPTYQRFIVYYMKCLELRTAG